MEQEPKVYHIYGINKDGEVDKDNKFECPEYYLLLNKGLMSFVQVGTSIENDTIEVPYDSKILGHVMEYTRLFFEHNPNVNEIPEPEKLVGKIDADTSIVYAYISNITQWESDFIDKILGDDFTKFLKYGNYAYAFDNAHLKQLICRKLAFKIVCRRGPGETFNTTDLFALFGVFNMDIFQVTDILHSLIFDNNRTFDNIAFKSKPKKT